MGFPLYIQDEVFEESIVDFFETADTNKDGVLDYNDFYAVSFYCELLASFLVHSHCHGT